jgi:hypothetical protein
MSLDKFHEQIRRARTNSHGLTNETTAAIAHLTRTTGQKILDFPYHFPAGPDDIAGACDPYFDNEFTPRQFPKKPPVRPSDGLRLRQVILHYTGIDEALAHKFPPEMRGKSHEHDLLFILGKAGLKETTNLDDTNSVQLLVTHNGGTVVTGRQFPVEPDFTHILANKPYQLDIKDIYRDYGQPNLQRIALVTMAYDKLGALCGFQPDLSSLDDIKSDWAEYVDYRVESEPNAENPLDRLPLIAVQ